jgi:putative aminopeptidase FrvX
MFSKPSLQFLKQLLDTPGPSGFESAPAKLWRDEAAKFAKVRGDVAGNSIAEINPEGSPTIMLAGHIDEIGVIVTYIDDEGYAYISGIGGWDPQVLVAQRIRFIGQGGDVFGVVGKKPIHLMKTEDREKASKMTDLWVDIGASSKEEALKRLSVGDPGVIDSRTMEFPNDRLVSRSIDDRIGAFIVLEALRRYSKNPGAAHVVAVAPECAPRVSVRRWHWWWTSRSRLIIHRSRRRKSVKRRSAEARCSRAARSYLRLSSIFFAKLPKRKRFRTPCTLPVAIRALMPTRST